MENIFIFDVTHFEDADEGHRETYSFEGAAEFEDFKVCSDFSGRVEIMRMDDCLNVYISEGEVEICFVCEKCLKPLKKTIDFSKTERQFYIKRPRTVEDLNDLYLVDTNRWEVDISEMVRQEIILHFPLNLVCSTHCKGLCPICGKDLNKVKCDCKVIDLSEKPLSILKEIYGKASSTKKETLIDKEKKPLRKL
jgi:uncharacterized metal-binding protein YceD (DUF177 family)